MFWLKRLKSNYFYLFLRSYPQAQAAPPSSPSVVMQRSFMQATQRRSTSKQKISQHNEKQQVPTRASFQDIHCDVHRRQDQACAHLSCSKADAGASQRALFPRAPNRSILCKWPPPCSSTIALRLSSCRPPGCTRPWCKCWRRMRTACRRRTIL